MNYYYFFVQNKIKEEIFCYLIFFSIVTFAQNIQTDILLSGYNDSESLTLGYQKHNLLDTSEEISLQGLFQQLF